MEGPYACEFPFCNKIYLNKSILKRHIQAFHSSVGRFRCSLCGKNLASKQNLKEHSYIHTGQKPYECLEPGCEETFRQGTHLSAHKREKHFALNTRSILLTSDLSISYLTSQISKILNNSHLIYLYQSPDPSTLNSLKLPPINDSHQILSVLKPLLN